MAHLPSFTFINQPHEFFKGPHDCMAAGISILACRIVPSRMQSLITFRHSNFTGTHVSGPLETDPVEAVLIRTIIPARFLQISPL